MEAAILVLDDLPPFREVVFDFEQQPCQRLRLLGEAVEVLRLKFRNPEEVRQGDFRLENIASVGQADILLLVVVVFVSDIPDYLFQNILQRYDAGGCPEFIDHYCHVDLICPEFIEQIVDLFRLRHKISRPQQCLPGIILRLIKVRKEVFGI